MTSAVNHRRPSRLGDEPLVAVRRYLCNQSEVGFEYDVPSANHWDL